jgi:outer membrane protein TolC
MSPNVSRSIRTEALPPEADREYLGIDGEVRVECDVDDVAREEFEGGRVGSGRGTGTDARARGTNGFFGNFDARSDADVNLYWEIQNLGLADRAIAKQRAAQQRTANPQLLKVQDRVASEVVRADKERIAASRQMAEAGRAVPEAQVSLALNLTNIRRGAGLPGATRPIEVLQPVQALAQARADYLDAVLAYNRAQFRLYRAIGRPPLVASTPVGAAGGVGLDPATPARPR